MWSLEYPGPCTHSHQPDGNVAAEVNLPPEYKVAELVQERMGLGWGEEERRGGERRIGGEEGKGGGRGKEGRLWKG